LGTPASLAFNYDAESHALGHRFDRPLRNKKKQAAYDDDDDDDDDDEYETNRGEGTRFDLRPGDEVASSGPYPDPQYSRMPPLHRVTQERTSRRITEWHPGEPDEEAMAKGVGRQVTPDGRIIGAVKSVGQDGLAGKGTQDDHSPGGLFDLETKSSKKTGPGQHVVIGNQHRAYVQNRVAHVEETGTLGLPGCMSEIIKTRLRECPQLRQ
jgi:hypothetical protein